MARTRLTATAASSGDNTLVAAPGAGKRIVVHYFLIELEASTATAMILKDGSTAVFRRYAANEGDGLVREFPGGAPWELTANAALILNLSGANTCGYNVEYEVVAA